jgi:hypothetical protein
MSSFKKNKLGAAGFVLALIAIVMNWITIPIIDKLQWLIWLAGLILSIIGMFRKPKTYAIAGLIISLIRIIILIIVGGLAAITALLSF